MAHFICTWGKAIHTGVVQNELRHLGKAVTSQFIRWPRSVPLKPFRARESPGHPVKAQILICWVWGGAWGSALLMGFQKCPGCLGPRPWRSPEFLQGWAYHFRHCLACTGLIPNVGPRGDLGQLERDPPRLEVSERQKLKREWERNRVKRNLMLPELHVHIIARGELKNLFQSSPSDPAMRLPSAITPLWVEISQLTYATGPQDLKVIFRSSSKSASPQVLPAFHLCLLPSVPTVIGSNVGMPVVHRNMMWSRCVSSESHNYPAVGTDESWDLGVRLLQKHRLTCEGAGSRHAVGVWPGASCSSYLAWLLK